MGVTLGGVHLMGQQADDVGADARMRLGAVRLRPTVEFNSGIDTNVFNASTNPRSDFAWTLSPKTEAALRLGKAQVLGKGSADFVYFQQSTTERSINTDGSMRLMLPFNRLKPFVSSSFLRTRQRPSLEIDARSRRRVRSISAGAAIRLSGKTEAEIVSTTSEVAFDGGETYFDTDLREAFNRTTRTHALSLRHRLTALTTGTLVIDMTDERFVFTPVRDSRSTRVAPEFEFASSALVSGKASVGYRQFQAHDSSMPDFRGAVASAELAYTLLGSTRFLFQARRDIEYSYAPTAPYYVISGVGLGVIRQITNSMGITARGARYRMTYRSLAADLPASAVGNADMVTIAGGGVLYKIGRDLRVQINVDHSRRVSALDLREYNGLRAGTSMTYGF